MPSPVIFFPCAALGVVQIKRGQQDAFGERCDRHESSGGEDEEPDSAQGSSSKPQSDPLAPPHVAQRNMKRSRHEEPARTTAPARPPRWGHPFPGECLLTDDILVGMRVKLTTASRRPDLVGSFGVATKFYREDNRFKVNLDSGEIVLVKPANMQAANTRPIPCRVPEQRDIKWDNAGASRAGGNDGGDIFPLADKEYWSEASSVDLRGFVAMEKYDGIRAMWEPSIGGECGFRTRGAGASMKLWRCTDPAMSTALEACKLRLDGEIWAGRSKWSEASHFMAGKWDGLVFKVFDAPSAPGGLLDRLEAARAALAPFETERVQVVQTAKCEDAATVRRLLTRIGSLGGEGLILRAADASFHTGRQKTIIKVKQFFSGLAMVVGKVPGKESLIVSTHEYGSRFDIAWHKSDRLGPMPANGTVLSYVYPGLNECGMPRFAGKIDNVHGRDEHGRDRAAPCDCEACQMARVPGAWPDDGLPSKSGMGGPAASAARQGAKAAAADAGGSSSTKAAAASTGGGSASASTEAAAAEAGGSASASASYSSAQGSTSASASRSTGAGASQQIVLPDKSNNQWVSRNKDKWTCSNQEVKEAPATNLFLAGEFDKLAGTYESLGGDENTWKAFALSKQAKILRDLAWEVTSATVERLTSVPKFGQKGVDKVKELLAHGKMQRLEMLQHSERVQAIEALTKVHGVGASTAKEWYSRGIKTVDEALKAGVMSGQQLVGARHWRDLEQRIPRSEVCEIVGSVRRALDAVLIAGGVNPEDVSRAADAIGAGSYRRGMPSSGDVDVLITRRDGGPDSGLISAVLEQLQNLGCEVDHLTHEEEVQSHGLANATRTASCQSYRGVIRLPGEGRLFRRLDVKVYPVEEFAYALLYFTGSDHFNRSMRHFAKQRGYSLSDHGLVAATKVGSQNVVRGTVNLYEAADEAGIFAALGLEYVDPTMRSTDVRPIGVPKIGIAAGGKAAGGSGAPL